MAKRKLNSIVWPNIPNDVYYLDADKVEYDDTETYSEGSVGDALQNKANIDGSYENLTAGNAEQLTTNIRANDQTPYLFRTSGGSVDIGDREYINDIVGGTVAWNQLVPNDRISGVITDTPASKDLHSLQLIAGHKYLYNINLSRASTGGTLNKDYQFVLRFLVGHLPSICLTVQQPLKSLALTPHSFPLCHHMCMKTGLLVT